MFHVRLWFNFFLFYSVPTIEQLLHTLVRSVVSAICSLSEPSDVVLSLLLYIIVIFSNAGLLTEN